MKNLVGNLKAIYQIKQNKKFYSKIKKMKTKTNKKLQINLSKIIKNQMKKKNQYSEMML